MGLLDELKESVKNIVTPAWRERDGRVIPSSSDIGLGKDGVRMSLAVLYSDIAGSTNLIRTKKDWFVAEIAKAFLVCAVRIIRQHGGVVTSFDGDRVMAVFHGSGNCTLAAKCGLKINYAVRQIIIPEIRQRYNDCKDFEFNHCTGVDASDVFIVRGGIRDNDDLVWIGQAPNYAAILSECRGGPSTYITDRVHDAMHDSVRYGGENGNENMWRDCYVDIAGERQRCYSSYWWWTP